MVQFQLYIRILPSLVINWILRPYQVFRWIGHVASIFVSAIYMSLDVSVCGLCIFQFLVDALLQ
jgi:hypothetical protein